MFPGLSILSYFLAVNDPNLIFILLICMFGFLLLASLAGFAHDLQNPVSRFVLWRIEPAAIPIPIREYSKASLDTLA
jgi:hypothetical protein